MAYPTIAQINDTIRQLMLDVQTPGGEIYTDARVFPMIRAAWLELWDALALYGVDRPKADFYALVASYMNILDPETAGLFNFMEPLGLRETAVTSTLTISGMPEAHTDGTVKLSFSTAHGLSNNAKVYVTKSWQCANGEWFVLSLDATSISLRGSSYYGVESVAGGQVVLGDMALSTRMTPATRWTPRAPQSTLGEYQWKDGRLRFHGATADRLVGIEATASAPPLSADLNQKLRVEGCDNFIAYRAASLLAAASQREDLFVKYAVLALGSGQKPDGTGGFLAGLVQQAARSLPKDQAQRATRP